MLGNSLTTANDLPALLGKKLSADIAVHARGGARLAEHLHPKTKLGALTEQALANESWDYVVLQESSNGPVMHRERFLEATNRLCERIRAVGATPVMFATWAYSRTCPKLAKMGISHDAMHAQLVDAYRTAAQTGNALVAEVGSAFFECEQKAELYRPDGIHPSATGTSLAVETIARRIASATASGSTQASYTVYILRCEDGSLYTGITTNMTRRLAEHMSRGPKAAKYTRTHPVAGVEATWEAFDRATASALEYRIKRLSRTEKLELIARAKAGVCPHGQAGAFTLPTDGGSISKTIAPNAFGSA